jgi:hypothetical protein
MKQKVNWTKSSKADHRKVWLAQRGGLAGEGVLDVVRFGSSDISTIMGFNKWSSRKKLYWNMLGMYKTDFKSFKLEMGLRYEDVNRESFECFTVGKEDFDERFCNGDKLRKLQSPKYFLLNDSYPHSFSSLDFVMPKKSLCPFTGEITTADRPVETKFVNFNSYATWKGVMPMYYYTQVQHQIMTMDSDAGYLSIIAGGDLYDCLFTVRDDEFITRMDAEVTDFQVRVLKAKQIKALLDKEVSTPNYDLEFAASLEAMLTELEPEANEHDLEFIESEMFPTTNKLEIKGGKYEQELIDRYLAAGVTENEAKSEKTLVRALLAESMQEFEILKTDTNKVTNRRSFDGRPYFKVS